MDEYKQINFTIKIDKKAVDKMKEIWENRDIGGKGEISFEEFMADPIIQYLYENEELKEDLIDELYEVRYKLKQICEWVERNLHPIKI